jgi:hypothetical protein
MVSSRYGVAAQAEGLASQIVRDLLLRSISARKRRHVDAAIRLCVCRMCSSRSSGRSSRLMVGAAHSPPDVLLDLVKCAVTCNSEQL